MLTHTSNTQYFHRYKLHYHLTSWSKLLIHLKSNQLLLGNIFPAVNCLLSEQNYTHLTDTWTPALCDFMTDQWLLGLFEMWWYKPTPTAMLLCSCFLPHQPQGDAAPSLPGGLTWNLVNPFMLNFADLMTFPLAPKNILPACTKLAQAYYSTS